MSEWAKAQACWDGFALRDLEYGTDFESCLTLKDTAKAKKRGVRKGKRETDGMSAQAEVVNLVKEFLGRG